MKFGVNGKNRTVIMRRKYMVVGLVGLTLVGSGGIMMAQTTPPAPQSPAPQPVVAAPDALPPLTDDQQKTLKKQEQAWRKTLKGADINDKDVQNAIVSFADERYRERMAIVAETDQLIKVVHDSTVPDDEVKDYLAGFRKAVAEERTRRASADAQTQLIQEVGDLDRKIGFSKAPRLESVLVLMGLLGDETQLAGTPPLFSPAAADSDDRPNNGSSHSGGHHHGMGGGGATGGPF